MPLLLSLAACGAFGADPAPTTPDAGFDAGFTGAPDAVADAGTKPFCAPHPGERLCEDFEGPAGMAAGWSIDDEGGRNQVAVVELDGAPSPRHALLTAVEPGAGARTDAYAWRAYEPVPKLTLEAKVRLGEVGAQSLVIAEIYEASRQIGLRLRSGGEVEESLSPDGGAAEKTLRASAPPPRVGEWTTISLTVDFEARRGTATVAGETVTFDLAPAWEPVSASVRVGLVDTSDDVRWVSHWDDVRVTVSKP